MRTASDVLRSLEQRIARLEGRRTAFDGYDRKINTPMGGIVEINNKALTKEQATYATTLTYNGGAVGKIFFNPKLVKQVTMHGTRAFGAFDFNAWTYLGYAPKKDAFLAVCTGVVGEDPMTFKPDLRFLILAIKAKSVTGPFTVKIIDNGIAFKGWKYKNNNAAVIDVITPKGGRTEIAPNELDLRVAHNRLAMTGIELSTLNPNDSKSVNLAEKAELNNTYEGQPLKVLVPKVSEKIKRMTMNSRDLLKIVEMSLTTVVYYAEKQVFGFGYDASFEHSDEDDEDMVEEGMGSFVMIVDLKGGNLKTIHEDFIKEQGESISLLERLQNKYGKPMLELM